MSELLNAKMQKVDSMSTKELKAMTAAKFNGFAAGLQIQEAKELFNHIFDRLKAECY